MSENISITRAIGSRAARAAPYWALFLVVVIVYFRMGPDSEVVWLPPLLLVGAIAPLSSVISDYRLQRIIENSDGEGVEGRLCAIHGNAAADNETDHDILACHFRVLSTEASVERTRDEARKRRYEDDKPLRYEGVYQIPMSIRTKSKTIRLCGFPNLTDHMPKKIDAGILENAKAQSRPGPSGIPAFIVREMLINRESRQVEMSLKYGKDPEDRFRRVEAWTLRAGDNVWIVGKLINGELRPATSRFLGLPVYFGPKDEVLSKLKSTRGFFLGVAIFFLMVAMAVAAFTLL